MSWSFSLVVVLNIGMESAWGMLTAIKSLATKFSIPIQTLALKFGKAQKNEAIVLADTYSR